MGVRPALPSRSPTLPADASSTLRHFYRYGRDLRDFDRVSGQVGGDDVIRTRCIADLSRALRAVPRTGKAGIASSLRQALDRHGS